MEPISWPFTSNPCAATTRPGCSATAPPPPLFSSSLRGSSPPPRSTIEPASAPRRPPPTAVQRCCPHLGSSLRVPRHGAAFVAQIRPDCFTTTSPFELPASTDPARLLRRRLRSLDLRQPVSLVPPCPWRYRICRRRRLLGPSSAGSAPAHAGPVFLGPDLRRPRSSPHPGARAPPSSASRRPPPTTGSTAPLRRPRLRRHRLHRRRSPPGSNDYIEYESDPLQQESYP